MKVMYVQWTAAAAYMIYYSIFTIAGPKYQSYVSILLPMIKLVLKNAISSGLYYLEDLTPSIVVMNVDVYHAIFVSTTMQQTNGHATVAIIMGVDIAQSIVAYYEVFRIVRLVNTKAKESREMEKYRTTIRDSARRLSRLASLMKSKNGPIDYALFLVDTYPRIRDHPSIALPRHLRAGHVTRSSLKRITPRTAQVSISPRDTFGLHSSPTLEGIAPSSSLSRTESAQLQCVQRVLQMLHMIEFYVLIEFIEAAVAAVYTLYVLAMSHMPNRAYYGQFSRLTDAELQLTITNMAIYTALEVLSFVVFCFAIDRELQHMSSIQQLAFVIQKHWKIVVPSFASSIFMVVEFSLEHFGMDFSLQFAWMGKKGT